jgi:nitrate/nitrite-specific signal transduction histidine kinase
MSLISNIRRSFVLQITCWVVGFAAVVWGVILLLLSHFYLTLLSGTVEGRSLMMIAIVTAVVNMLVLALLIWWTARRHLHPLDKLADSAQHIASGDSSGMVVPHTERCDEVGQLQNSFATMQQALTNYMTEMRQKRDGLAMQNQALERAYEQSRQADGVKTEFLKRMSVQMLQTVQKIDELTAQICEHYAELSPTDMMRIKIEITANTDSVTRQLEKMLISSEDRGRS